MRARFYQQTRAIFYRDAGETLSYESVGPVGQYFTGDHELSPFWDLLVGAKVAYTRSADAKGRLLRLLNDLDLSSAPTRPPRPRAPTRAPNERGSRSATSSSATARR
jgi:hypothetical protein